MVGGCLLFDVRRLLLSYMLCCLVVVVACGLCMVRCGLFAAGCLRLCVCRFMYVAVVAVAAGWLPDDCCVWFVICC